jgi:glutamate 5-kinase
MNICVIKAGSAIVTQNDNTLDLNAIQNICQQIIYLSKIGWKIVLVSSGAVACGKGLLLNRDDKRNRKNEYSNSIMASLGQGKLISYYSSLINTNNSNLDVGQVLVTRKAISSKENFNNLKNIILGMLDANIIPIINENDVLGMHGISFTDNDQLAAIISVMVDAKISILLSEIGAVYTRNPQIYNDAIRLKELDFATNYKQIEVDDSHSSRGGMQSKLDFFNIMNTFGNQCVLIGKEDIKNLSKSIEGKIEIGTTLKNNQTKKNSAMKKWLATSAIPKGMVLVSPLGAEIMAGKTKNKTKSNLYSSGICGYFGKFDKGDIVSIRDEKLNLIGIGRSKCSCADLENKNYGDVFIHENDFFQLNKHYFIDSDMLNIRATLLKLRKRLFLSDDEKIIISPLNSDIDLSVTSIEKESIIINRSEVSDLISLWKDAKRNFSLNFEDWMIYATLEGVYEKN